jgi:GNAT superfamily N-acetyltransferase
VLTDKKFARKAERKDLSEILSLYEYLHPDEKLSEISKALRNKWDFLCDNEFFHYFVVDCENGIASTCSLSIIPNLTRNGRSFGLIENVVTSKYHRMKGCAKLVIGAALDFAWANDCYKVILETDNYRRLDQFYEKIGFQKGQKTAWIIRRAV